MPDDQGSVIFAGEADVRACYDLFLGREPESVHVVTSRYGQRLTDVVRGFVSSEEYINRIERLAETPVEDLRPDLAMWALRLPLTVSSIERLGQPRSRDAVARIVLTDSMLARELLNLKRGETQKLGIAAVRGPQPKFRLMNQVCSTGAEGGYNALGPDPYLFLEQALPAGYVRIRLSLRFPEAVDPHGLARFMQIFLSGQSGIVEDNSWTFSASTAEVSYDSILYTPYPVNFLRIDPTNQPGIFQLYDFHVCHLSMEDAQSQMFAQWHALLETSNEAWRTAPFIAEFFHPGRARRLTQLLTDPLRVEGDRYDAWVARRSVNAILHAELSARGQRLIKQPKFSILLPTYNSDLYYLELAVRSVLDQTYGLWQLCIVDDGSTRPEVATYLAGLQLKDARILVEKSEFNGGIAKATNMALASADGEFVALLDHDDELAPHALFAMAHAINRMPDADFLYSDEDKITMEGRRFGPLFKPDWSPEFMLGCMYTCHLGVYRTELVREVGGFRSEFDLAQDYDLALRISRKARSIVHVPDVLYHWRILPTSTASSANAKPTAELAARRAVQAHRDALGLKGEVVAGAFPGVHRVLPAVDPSRRISIVIPSAARRIKSDVAQWYLLDLLHSIFYHSTHRSFEIVLVHNGDIEPKLEEALRPFDLVYVLYDKPVFNIAEKMNLGVAHASSDVVLLLNDDMTLISSDWLEQMLMWLDDPGIAGVGAKLFFPSGNIQHAGVLLPGQGPGHVYYNLPANTPGLAGSAFLVRNYSALTGACLMVRKADYERIGGFDTKFRLNYNDVDFCLRLGELGRLVYTPFANLYHYESVSREPGPPGELIDFNSKWKNFIGADPMYNRNMSQNSSSDEVTLYPRPVLMDYPE